MRAIIASAVLATVTVSSAQAETRWWTLTPIGDECVDAHGYGNSPAEAIDAFRLVGIKSEIADKGDEVDVVAPNDPKGLRFFRHA